MNRIIIELCEEDRARIDSLIEKAGELISLLPPRITVDSAPIIKEHDDTVKTAAEPTPKATEEDTVAHVAEEEKVVEPTEKEEVTEAKKTASPSVTLDEIQKKVIQLCAGFGGTKKAAVREIVNAYAPKVSDLPEDKWDEVWQKLTALEEVRV